MTPDTLLFLTLFASIALLVGWATWLLVRNDDRLRQRLRNPGFQRALRQERMTFATFVERVGQVAAAPFMPTQAQKISALRKQLASAGIYSPAAIKTVSGFKVLLLGIGLVGGYVAGALLDNAFLGLSFGGIVGYLLPALWLRSAIRKNQRALQFGLPDALDLMVVCVEAGLTLDAALQRISMELALAHPRLSRELELTHMETRLGISRIDALRNLGNRTTNPALQALATLLVQSDRFGTSVAQALRTHAETLRAQRQNIAEETAAKASVKLTFPVVLFIFPAVLIVLAGPAAIGLLKSALFN
jgi:tight adherence protein C